jgi:hypothetical protein
VVVVTVVGRISIKLCPKRNPAGIEANLARGKILSQARHCRKT